MVGEVLTESLHGSYTSRINQNKSLHYNLKICLCEQRAATVHLDVLHKVQRRVAMFNSCTCDWGNEKEAQNCVYIVVEA